jgi:cystathionine beta-lyase
MKLHSKASAGVGFSKLEDKPMAKDHGLSRRSFLTNTGVTAFAGIVGKAMPASAASTTAPAGGTFDFDTPYNRIGTDSVKWDQQIRVFGKENIEVGMGIADMDFRTAPVITEALNKRLQHENWGYLDMPHSFADGIVSWNKRRYGIEINPESLIITTGVHAGLVAALRTFSPPGSKVLLLTPTYDGFYSDISFVGCKPEESLMKLREGRYSIDFDDLERRISHDTNTLILCNPQNPTGNLWSPEDLMRVGEICTRRRVVVLADEIHCDFVMKGNKYTPYSTLPDKNIVKNSITFKAASKSFGLAAMKCGWFFSDNADYIARVKANNKADLTTLGMIASQSAYAGGEEWLNQVVSYIDGNFDFVESFIKANLPLVKFVKPQGTYLAWLDVSGVAAKTGARKLAAEPVNGKPVTPEAVVQRFFVTNAKVHLNPGSSYGLGGADHMRMNIATSRKTLELALTNLAKALNKV